MYEQNYARLNGVSFTRSSSEELVDHTIPPRSKPRRSRIEKRVSVNETTKAGKRGRPRVDTKNQDAVERRRTQIRLAQRAYRERKETTISALEQQVAQLKEIINDMNQTFLDYNKKAISSGIIGWNSTVGHDLKEATQRFLHLAKNANLECDSDEPEQSQGSEQNFDYEARVRQSTALGSNSYAPLSEQSWLDTSIPVKRVPVGMWGYEVTSEPEPVSGCQRLTEDMNNLDKTDEPDYGLVAEQDAPSDVNLHQDLTDIVVSTSLIQDFQLNPSIDNHLTPDYTYSFQETTFARRLLRSSYETAFRLLNDPSTPRSEIYRRLRYTFCWANMDDILTCLQLILSRSNKESLENWDFPNLHTGNAGFHFPRGSLDNGAPPPEKWGHRKNIGPWRQGRAQNRDAEAAGPDSYAHFAKCEGTWFDPNDVEEYYKTKGLFLDGWSSVAELEIDAPGDLTSSREMTMGSPSSLSAESLLDPQSPLNYLANATIDIFDTSTDYFLNPNNDGDYIFPPARELEDRGVTDIPFKVPDVHSQPGVDIETQQSEFYRGQTLTPKKRKVIIDVDKLLETLNRQTVCIGRAPGYRKEGVDFAFTKAVEEAI